jgi:uncharacterized RDD family membrane protein YckC
MVEYGDPQNDARASALRSLPPDASRRVGALGPIETVESPEQVQLDLELAGPMSRAFAFSIDYSVVLLLLLLCVIVLFAGSVQFAEWFSEIRVLQDLMERMMNWLGEGEPADSETQWKALMLMLGAWMFFDLVLATLYFLLFETLLQGRTLGKRVTHLRVVTLGGGIPTWRESLTRNLLRTVDGLPAGYVVGAVAMIFSPRVQRLGDVAAGTLVIRERENTSLSAVADRRLSEDVEASFQLTRDELSKVGEVERRLIRRTLRRVEALSDLEAEPIIARTAQAITRRIGREETLPAGSEVDFLIALLQASERIL